MPPLLLNYLCKFHIYSKINVKIQGAGPLCRVADCTEKMALETFCIIKLLYLSRMQRHHFSEIIVVSSVNQQRTKRIKQNTGLVVLRISIRVHKFDSVGRWSAGWFRRSGHVLI